MSDEKIINTFDDDDDCQLPELPPLNELEVGRQVTEPPTWATERGSILDRLKRPGIAALTGGIGAGKSLVAEMFVELGAGHIDFDHLARRVIEPGTSGVSAVVELLGTRVINKGALDRAKIAALVYADEEIRKRLEEITHPRIWIMMGKELDNTDDSRLIVLSIPLLFEIGLETFFHPIILVYADLELRLKRLLVRDEKVDETIARRIIDAQWPDPPKIMGSTYVIHNGGSLMHTRNQVKQIYEEIDSALRPPLPTWPGGV